MFRKQRNKYASEVAWAVTGQRHDQPEYERVRAMLIGLQARGVMFDSLGPPPSLAEVEAAWQLSSIHAPLDTESSESADSTPAPRDP